MQVPPRIHNCPEQDRINFLTIICQVCQTGVSINAQTSLVLIC